MSEEQEKLVVEEEKLEVEKDVITEIPEVETAKPETRTDLGNWQPKTSLGKTDKKAIRLKRELVRSPL